MIANTVLILGLLASASAGLFGLFETNQDSYVLLCNKTGPIRCECPRDDTSNVVDCTSRRIKDLPVNIKFDDYVMEVSFSKNKLTSIPNTVFVSGLRVERIDLSYNAIHFVSQDAFAGIENLKYIDLSHNAIWSLAIGTFRGPKYMKSLNLAYNKISDFFPETFTDMTELKELNFKFNPILSVEKDSFGFLVGLEDLDLSSTGMANLPDNVFANNTQLKVLKLTTNSFISVPSKAIRSAKSLKRLDISENPIEKIKSKDFYGASVLEMLEITHMRKLSSLERYSLSGLANLKELYLSDNLKLSKISGLTFKFPKKVKADGSSDSEEDDDDDKEPNPFLAKVSFRHNALQWIPEDLLDWTLIKDLDLRDNPWHCDCHLGWVARTAVPGIIKEGAQCSTPSRLSGRSFSALKSSDFTCSYLTSEATIALSILVVAAFLLALGGVAFLMYKRSLLTCRKKEREPKYTRVVSTKDKVDLEWDHTAEPESQA